MNVQLRKRHQKIWIGLGLAMLILFVEGIDTIPKNPNNSIPISYCPLGTASCASTHSESEPNAPLIWHIEPKSDIVSLSIYLNLPIKSGFTVVKIKGVFGEMVLGQMNEMNLYTFDIPTSLFDQSDLIEINDHLKNEILFTKKVSELTK